MAVIKGMSLWLGLIESSGGLLRGSIRFTVELKIELCGEVVLGRGEVALFRGEVDNNFAPSFSPNLSLVSPLILPLGCLGMVSASSLDQPDLMR